MKRILIVGVYAYPDIPEAHRIIQVEIKGQRCDLKYGDENEPVDGFNQILVFCNDWSATPMDLVWRAKEAGIPLSLFVNTKEET